MSTAQLEARLSALETYTKNETERLQQEKELGDQLLIDLVELLAKSHAFSLSEIENVFKKQLSTLEENAHHNPNAFYNATRKIHRLRMAIACGLEEQQTDLTKHRNKVFKSFDAFRKSQETE